jgi:hypothetical protein
VGGEDDGDAGLPQRADERPDRQPGLRVEAGGGLVEEDDLGPPDDGEREPQPLALTSGQAPDGGPQNGFEAEIGGQACGVDGMRVQGGDVPEHLAGTCSGREATVLEQHADARSQPGAVAVRVEAEHADRSGVRAAQPLAALDGRRLARPVGPEHGGDGAARRGQAEPVDDGATGVALDETVDLERGVGHIRECRQRPSAPPWEPDPHLPVALRR